MIRLAFLCIALVSTDAVAQRSLSASEISRIDAMFLPFDHDGSPGFAVGVVRDGRLVYARGFGRADLDNNVPITPRTSFHLASLSKQFTAAAIALLILDGKVSLNTPVESYFPEVKKYGADLRIKHLIYFTSGLHEYMSIPRLSRMPWFSFYYFTTDEAIAAALSKPTLKFTPGTQWEYSNVNYMLLAKIVERVSGMSLSRFLETRVFAPLEMKASQLNDDSTLVIRNRATGYADRSDEKIREQLRSVGINVNEGTGYVRLPRVSPHYGGSGVFSTIEDLAKWDENFYSNRLAGPAFTKQMLHREAFKHGKDDDAFGLVVGSFQGRQMLWFSGGDLDGSTFVARLPEEHLTVICLSNMPSGNAEEKARAVLNVLLESEASPESRD